MVRRAFEDDARESRIIETIPKLGYRLLAGVVPANGRPESPGDILTNAEETRPVIASTHGTRIGIGPRLLALFSY